MLNRWIGILAFFAMISVNAALIYRDMLPGWIAGEPPDADAALLSPGEIRKVQVGIFDDRGKLVGRSWTRSEMAEDRSLLIVRSWTLLEKRPLPDGLETPRLRVDTVLNYQQDVCVDMLTIRVHGLGVTAVIEGEYIDPNDFPCKWQFGLQQGKFILSADATRALGDVIKPFDRLPGLYVGRTWRLKLLNPLAQMLPGLNLGDISLRSTLVRVTALESIEHNGESVSAYRVEADRVVAWVAEDGRVLRQQVDLPIIGRLIVLDEPFEDNLLFQALKTELGD